MRLIEPFAKYLKMKFKKQSIPEVFFFVKISLNIVGIIGFFYLG